MTTREMIAVVGYVESIRRQLAPMSHEDRIRVLTIALAQLAAEEGLRPSDIANEVEDIAFTYQAALALSEKR